VIAFFHSSFLRIVVLDDPDALSERDSFNIYSSHFKTVIQRQLKYCSSEYKSGYSSSDLISIGLIANANALGRLELSCLSVHFPDDSSSRQSSQLWRCSTICQ